MPDEETMLPDDPIAEPDEATVEAPSKPKRCPLAAACGVIAGLAFLFLLAETAVRAAQGIANYSTPAWLYWPWAVGIKQVLFLLLPAVCFALALFGAKRRRPVFLLLAAAWQATALLYDIWYIGQAELSAILRMFLPMLLGLAAMLVLLARTEKAAAPPPLTAAGIFMGALMAYASLEYVLHYAVTPYYGPEGLAYAVIYGLPLVLLAPFYIRKAGRVRVVHIVFLSLALLYSAFFTWGTKALGAIAYAAYGQVPLTEALGAAVPNLCIIASLVVALVFAIKAWRAIWKKKRITITVEPIGGEAPEEQAEQVEQVELEEEAELRPEEEDS